MVDADRGAAGGRRGARARRAGRRRRRARGAQAAAGGTGRATTARTSPSSAAGRRPRWPPRWPLSARRRRSWTWPSTRAGRTRSGSARSSTTTGWRCAARRSPGCRAGRRTGGTGPGCPRRRSRCCAPAAPTSARHLVTDVVPLAEAPAAARRPRRPPPARPAGRLRGLALHAGGAVRGADRLGLGRPALAQVDRRTAPSRPPRGTRTASSAGCGSRSRPTSRSRPRTPGPTARTICSALYAARPATDWASQEPRKISAHHQAERAGVDARCASRRPSPTAGESLVGVPADLLLLRRTPGPTSSTGFDSGRAALHEPHRGEDEQEELQVLRLPVLRDVDGEGGRGDVAPEGDRIAAGGRAAGCCSRPARRPPARPARAGRSRRRTG